MINLARTVHGGLMTLLLLGSPVGAGAADTDDWPDLFTDRPDFIENTFVVPRGVLQLESGMTLLNSSDGSRVFGLPEWIFRRGIGGRNELRFGPPNVAMSWGNGSGRTLIGDTYVGMKRQLTGDGRFTAALIPALSVPTGARGNSTGSIDPEVKLTMGYDLDEKTATAVMLAYFWPKDGFRRHGRFQVTAGISRDLGNRLSTFTEHVWTHPERGPDEFLLHHGYAYRLSRDAQLDLHLGAGVSRTAPDFLIGAGLVVRY